MISSVHNGSKEIGITRTLFGIRVWLANEKDTVDTIKKKRTNK